jgi:hypothetical protein
MDNVAQGIRAAYERTIMIRATPHAGAPMNRSVRKVTFLHAVRLAAVVGSLIFPPGTGFASCLEEAAGFAERVCGELSNRGSSQLISGSGTLNAEAKGLIARMLGSAQGDAKVDAAVSTYENVTREELAKDHENIINCRMKMIEAAVKQVCPEAADKKDRTKVIGNLQKAYVSGNTIRQNLLPRTITDEQIDLFGTEADKWYVETCTWIKTNMSDGALARFTDNSDKPSFSFELDGTHSAEEKKNATLF